MSEPNTPDQSAGETSSSEAPSSEAPSSEAPGGGETPIEAISQSSVQKPPVYVTDMREADTSDTKQSRSR
jgi:hypothetical protein